MEPEGFWERDHNLSDMMVLLAVVCLALVTWLYLADANIVPLWKSITCIAFALLFGLAALTRHPHRASCIRFMIGGWTIVAPYLLGFASISPAFWAYLAIGTFLTTLSLPAIVTLHASRRCFGIPDADGDVATS